MCHYCYYCGSAIPVKKQVSSIISFICDGASTLQHSPEGAIMGTDSRDPEDLAAKSHHWSDEIKFTTEEIAAFCSDNLFFLFTSLIFSW